MTIASSTPSGESSKSTGEMPVSTEIAAMLYVKDSLWIRNLGLRSMMRFQGYLQIHHQKA
jgi:hypothetical protein